MEHRLAGYFSFPRCIESFVTAQSDARRYERDGCIFRKRGRSVSTHRYTLVSFEDKETAVRVVEDMRSSGMKVSSLNFMCERPRIGKVSKGPTEYQIGEDYPFESNGEVSVGRVDDFSPAIVVDRIILRRWRRRMLQSPYEVRSLDKSDREEIYKVFDGWVEWAKERHFMVFTGHYRRWIEMYFEDWVNCSLLGFFDKGDMKAIFGYEIFNSSSQVIILKHLPGSRLLPVYVWLDGLSRILEKGVQKVYCGSTADELKSRLGFQPHVSWRF